MYVQSCDYTQLMCSRKNLLCRGHTKVSWTGWEIFYSISDQNAFDAREKITVKCWWWCKKKPKLEWVLRRKTFSCFCSAVRVIQKDDGCCRNLYCIRWESSLMAREQETSLCLCDGVETEQVGRSNIIVGLWAVRHSAQQLRQTTTPWVHNWFICFTFVLCSCG